MKKLLEVLTTIYSRRTAVCTAAILGFFIAYSSGGCGRNLYSARNPMAPVIESITVYDQPAVPGVSFTADVVAFSPQNLPLTYRWSTTSGWTLPSNANSSIATITAPASYAASGTLSVTVVDTDGKSATGSRGIGTFREPFIIFVSARDGDYSIYRMEEDGSSVTRLSDPSADCVLNQCFDMSPDVCKNTVAFSSNRSGRFQIYTMSVYGTGLSRLTHIPGADADAPDYSSDCRELCYTVAQSTTRQIECMDLQTSFVTDVTHDDGSGACCGRFSPDNSTIAYIHDPLPSAAATPGTEPPMSIYTISPDGSNRQWLCNTAGVSPPLSWSPDGTGILFVGPSPTTGYSQIFSMPLDCGSLPAALTDPSYNCKDPAFSRDGKTIAYTSTQYGNSRIFLMNADGSNPRELTNDIHLNDQPIW